MTTRGDDIARPQPWTVRAADRRAGIGWDELLRQVPEAADRAWVSITRRPPSDRQPSASPQGQPQCRHRRGSVQGTVAVEVTAGGRIWYGIDDTTRTLWITQAGTAHPRQTDRGKHR